MIGTINREKQSALGELYHAIIYEFQSNAEAE